MVSGTKRITVLIFVALTIAALFVLPVDAADIYFSVINDNEPEELSSSTMPLEINGTIYIHYKLFNNRTELGTSAFDSKRSAIIIKDSTYLEFNLDKNTTHDQDRNEYRYRAIVKSGEIFVPVYEVCKFFGLEYSKITDTDAGTIIRIKKDFILDDSTYASAASGIMQQMLKNYLQSQTDSSAPPTPSETPYDKSDVNVYISVFGSVGERRDEFLWKLDFYGYKACFFVTAEEIKENPNQIRRIMGTGHKIGLLLGENIEEDYIEASKYLKAAADTKTILVASSVRLTEDMKAQGEDMGIVFWYDGSCTRYSTEDGFSAGAVRRMLKSSRSRVDLILKADEEVLAGIDILLNELSAGSFNVRKVRETEPTCIEY